MSDNEELNSDDDESHQGAESPVPEMNLEGPTFDIATGVRVEEDACKAHHNVTGSSGTQKVVCSKRDCKLKLHARRREQGDVGHAGVYLAYHKASSKTPQADPAGLVSAGFYDLQEVDEQQAREEEEMKVAAQDQEELSGSE